MIHYRKSRPSKPQKSFSLEFLLTEKCEEGVGVMDLVEVEGTNVEPRGGENERVETNEDA